MQGSCALDVKDVATLLTFKSIDPGNVTSALATALADRMPDFAGAELSLFFANCETDTQVSFDVTASLYNVKGERKDFLGVGEDSLPAVYMVRCCCCCCYCCCYKATAVTVLTYLARRSNLWPLQWRLRSGWGCCCGRESSGTRYITS